MKKVIDRMVYDTRKAKQIHKYNNSNPRESAYYEEEILYLSKKGQFFIIGKGGGMTSFALADVSQEKVGSSKLWTVSKDQAILWLESHEGDDLLLNDKLFEGIVKEG